MNDVSKPTRRMEPGLARRMSMGMGTMTLAGAAFFGVAAHAEGPASDDGTSHEAADPATQ